MSLKKFILLNVMISIFTLNLFSHKAPIRIFVKTLKNDFINIKAKMGEEGSFISALPIKVISIVNNKAIQKKIIIIKEGLSIKIPQESYMIVLTSNGQDIILDGPAPSSGFKRTAIRELYAFKYTSIVSFFFMILSLLIIFRRKYT